jgi:hypothetical protein
MDYVVSCVRTDRCANVGLLGNLLLCFSKANSFESWSDSIRTQTNTSICDHHRTQYSMSGYLRTPYWLPMRGTAVKFQRFSFSIGKPAMSRIYFPAYQITLPGPVQPRRDKGALGFGMPSLSSNILFYMVPADGHNSDLGIKVGSIKYSNSRLNFSCAIPFHNLCLGGEIRVKKMFFILFNVSPLICKTRFLASVGVIMPLTTH